MRKPLRTTVAIALAAAGLATGCGSDDDEPQRSDSDAPAAEERADAAKSDAKDEGSGEAAAKPKKKKSVRAEMVTCIEDEGFEVTHKGQDAEAATNYTVEGDGGDRRAVINIHPNRQEAENASINAGEDKGLNAVAFGRAEFIRYDATDTEAGVIVNCIAEAYVH